MFCYLILALVVDVQRLTELVIPVEQTTSKINRSSAYLTTVAGIPDFWNILSNECK